MTENLNAGMNWKMKQDQQDLVTQKTCPETQMLRTVMNDWGALVHHARSADPLDEIQVRTYEKFAEWAAPTLYDQVIQHADKTGAREKYNNLVALFNNSINKIADDLERRNTIIDYYNQADSIVRGKEHEKDIPHIA
jgi:hypothetical protein